jgi:hypothetical protein
LNTIEKIANVLKVKEITLTKAERLMGVSQGVLVKAVQRGGSLHEATQEKFIRTFEVNRDWWETGKGEMLNEKGTEVPETLNKVEEEAMKYVSPLVETQLKLIKSQEELIDLLRAEVKGLREQLRVLSEKPGA